MKIRTDFVSNSSSSSFVFSADFKRFSFGDFVESVCDECDGGENDDVTRENNKAILNYCMKYFELLHLGRLKLGRKKEIIRRGYDRDGNKIENKDDLAYSRFEIIRETYVNGKLYYNDNSATAKMVDADTIEYEYDEFAPDNIIVMRQSMLDIRNSGRWVYGKKPSKSESLKSRVSQIMNIVKLAGAIGDSVWKTPYGAGTYLITRNTISNTRDLIEAGYDIQLAKWEDLSALEARLSAGETVFHIECGDSGEGEDDMRLFSHASQYPFDGVPLENIRGGNL